MSFLLSKSLLWFALIIFILGCKPQPKTNYYQPNPKYTFDTLTNTFTVKLLKDTNAPPKELHHLAITSEINSRYEITFPRRWGRQPIWGNVVSNETAMVELEMTNTVAVFTNGVFLDGTALALGLNQFGIIRLEVMSAEATLAAESRRKDLEQELISIMKQVEDKSLVKGITPKQIDALVLDLRSKNNPINAGFGTLKVPRNYDFEAQKKVYLAEQKLSLLGPSAFEALVRHINDKAYCQTDLWNDYNTDWNVGEICRYILTCQIEVVHFPYGKGRRLGDGMVYWFGSYSHAVAKYGSEEKWWKANRNRSLKEMQIEALECSIKREKEYGFSNSDEEKFIIEKLETALEKLR